MNQIRAMRVFLRVAELGSLSAASTDLGFKRGMASAILKELEDYLGVQLVERTTRALRLTDEGVHYAERARAILSEVEALEEEIGGSEREPTGHLRVQIPPGLARVVVAPALPRFFADCPKVTLDILSANAVPDFIGSRLDAAVFVGPLPDSGIAARVIGRAPTLVVASPDYIARHGAPETPDDLARHSAIRILSSADGTPVPWRLGRKGEVRTLLPEGSLAFGGNEVAVAAATAGLGLFQVASYVVYGAVRSGRLVPVLRDWQPPAEDIRLLHPRHVRKPRKLRAFEEFLVDTGRRFRRDWRIARID